MGSLMWTPVPAWKATLLLFNIISAAVARKHIVYWNSTNTRLTAGDLSIQVNLNDYLDIYCPHYPDKTALHHGQPETLALYLVNEASFRGCVTNKEATKRWECNDPYATYGPVRFTEKIHRFTPFSLGYEFLPGKTYYFNSLPTDEGPHLPCMKLRVTVCCKTKSEGSKQKQETSAPRSGVCALSISSRSLLLLSFLLTFLLPAT